MAYHAPFGTDETPEIYTKIIGSKPIDFTCCQRATNQRIYDNIRIGNLPQYQHIQREYSLFYGFDRNFGAMRNGNTYHTVAPWEYGKAQDIIKPRKKMFQRDEFVVRNQDLSPREIKPVLPPIGVRRAMKEDEKRLLRMTFKDIFAKHGTELIDLLKKDFIKVDLMKSGTIEINKVLKLMRAYEIYLDGDMTKVFTRAFTSEGSNAVLYLDLISFLKGAANGIGTQTVKGQVPNIVDNKKRKKPASISSDEISPKPNLIFPVGIDYTQPFAVNSQARADVRRISIQKRDKELLHEMEKSLRGYRGDSLFLIQQFKNNLKDKIGYNKPVSTYQLKDMVSRHRLPFNIALVDKLFDRLDPTGTGNIYWEEFVDFLEQAMPAHEEIFVNTRAPPWEKKQPLKSIASKNSETDSTVSKQTSTKSYLAVPKQQDSFVQPKTKKKTPRRPESRLQKVILLIQELRKKADPKTELLDAEEARRIMQNYDVIYQLGMPNAFINEIIERSDFDGTVDVNDLVGYLGGPI